MAPEAGEFISRLLMYVLPNGYHRKFIDEADRDSKPFVWTAKPRKILAAINRGRKR
jgi:hypothetical protein